MSNELPTPPTSLSTGIADALNNLSPNSLRNVAHYVKELTEHKEREVCREEEPPEGELEERPDDLPDDIPTRATIMIKEISDKRYYYRQWREDDKVKSKYKGPINSGGQEGQLP